MKQKEIIVTTILCIFILGLYFMIGSYQEIKSGQKVYNVYLDGEIIGAIASKDALYDLIDEREQNIKDKYHVSNVYPPESLKIEETYSYNTEITNLGSIYKKIEELQDFTIHGYEVSVNKTDNEESFKFYVLDKKVLNEAIEKFILAFIDEDDYNAYLTNKQKKLDDIGVYYSEMGILENITIREKYISVNETIYDNSETLAQQLLFGFNYKEQSYTIKAGDTIESISEANTLNTQEFLIANPEYSSKDSLLAIGDKVNITLINPEISFSYKVKEMKEVEYPFDTEVVVDSTKDANYSEITQPGVIGLSLQTSEYTVVNGEPNSNVTLLEDITIRQKVDQIRTKGKKVTSIQWGTDTYDYSDSGWRWPTIIPYAVTSEFAPRWGKVHGGIDISGTGLGSKIFAANDGTVVHVNNTCSDMGYYGSTCGSGFGNFVIIDHGNNIYTLYGHVLSNIPVKEGQNVSKGTVIAYMGNSGSSTGVHLHFSFANGDPRNGGTYFDPRKIFPKR